MNTNLSYEYFRKGTLKEVEGGKLWRTAASVSKYKSIQVNTYLDLD